MSRNFVFIGFCLCFLSCERIIRKADHVKTEVRQKVEIKIHTLSDKFAPKFDATRPDTKNNKTRFKDFIQVELSPDVKNIYCFADAIGLDSDYMFSFECIASTSDKIIALHNFRIDSTSTDNGFRIQHDFAWWDKARIAKIPKYSWTDGKGYYKYYWYDAQIGRAYFFDFDL